jgi:TolA-binding protein
MASLRFLAGSVLWLLVAAPWSAIAEEPKEPLPWDNAERLPSQAATLLQDRRYEEAAAALKALAAKAGAPADRLLYAEGRAWTFAGKYDEAAAALARVEKEFPKSPWARRARFARGVALAKKGDFASAESIYRAEAEYLLSHERKQELADIYLGFARKYATPRTERSPPDQPPPDYAKALTFFEQALELGPRPEMRPEIELQIAECHRHGGDFEEAYRRYNEFVKQWPDDPRTPEARYRAGYCKLRQGDGPFARRAFEDLLALWPGDKLPADKAQAEYVVRAAYDLGLTYGLPQPPSDEDLASGIAALDAFIKRFPDHELAVSARVVQLQARMSRGRFADAATAAKEFLADARRAELPQSADVRNLLGLALRQQGKFTEAIAAWREFLTKHPSHAGWSGVQQQLIETDYLLGAEAYNKKNYDEARKLWTEFLIRYPLDSRSPRILFHFGEAEFRQARYEAAIEEWRRLISKYPGTDPASEAQFRIGLVLEEKLGKPAEAMREYVKTHWGSHQQAARSRVALLTAKQLTIETERVFRTNEVPKITVRSRNIDRLRVRVYKLDLETYFRKMHLAGGVESLDLALIDPDRTFEFTVPDYAEFKPQQSAIELPGLAADKADDKPGVVAVTVAGKTLEATTLVLRSDLEVIVKSSRDEVFVFAQNLRTGKPWPAARVLVSDGGEIVSEATTGQDGVFRASPERLKQTSDVRVFAESVGHTASNQVSLQGVGVAQSLQERGFLYTDRNGYRPGNVVHVRGIVRAVVDDRYVAAPKRKYRLDVFDSRSRVVYSDDVTSGDFGSFHKFFVLPEGAAPGEYRLQASDVDGRSFAGTFRVENYQVEPVRIVVDLPRKVYFRGEEIEGTIKAEFYYGTPLTGREVRYSLAGGEVKTATTDDQGRVPLKFATREFREAQSLELRVELPERNLYTTERIILAVRAFSIGVKLPRDVVTVGESFPVTLETNGADGKPTGEKLKLEVVEKTVVDGRAGDRVVGTHAVATDPKTGLGRLTLSLETGGRYELRATATDRFQNPVLGKNSLFVSGDDDKVRLRILSDVHNYRVGDDAVVRVHWREAPALALATFQGAKILEYRLVELKTGDNLLKVPMQPHLAPNFFLEVNVMTDVREAGVGTGKPAAKVADAAKVPESSRVRLHSATNQFFVERPLQVGLTIKPRTDGRKPQPGEVVDILVTTRDAQDRAVAAELSLAMIDQSGIERFGAVARGFTQAFTGMSREPAMRTAASITFHYRPQTKAINTRLLTEEERLEIAAQDAELLQSLSTTTVAGTIAQGYAFSDLKSGSGAVTFGGIVVDEQSAGVAGPMSGEVAGRGLIAAAEDKPQPASEPQSVTLNLGGAMPQGRLPELAKKSDLDAPERKREQSDRAANQRFAMGRNEALLRDNAIDALGIDARRLSRAAVENYFNEGGRELTVVNGGVQGNVRLGEDRKGAEREVLLRRLQAEQALVLAAVEQQETAYWNPAIVTDAKGTATVAVTLPERSTVWKLAAHGISVETLVGEAQSYLAVKKELFGELAAPAVATDGDSLQIPVTVHDLVERKPGTAATPIEVTLTTRIGDKKTEERRTLPAEKSGLHELTFQAVARLPEHDKGAAIGSTDVVELTLTVAAGEQRDTARSTVAIRPYGYEIASSTGGVATSDTMTWLEEPAGMKLERPTLTIAVGGSVDAGLLDIVLGTDPHCGWNARYASPLETTTSDLLAAVALEKYLRAKGDAAAAQAPSLTARIRASIGTLIAAQLDDGGWSWTGSGSTADRLASARCVWALAAARKAGHRVPDEAFEKSLTYLANQQAAIAVDDLEAQAIVLHAMSEADRGDFSVANRLYRNRSTISPAGAAYLALALQRLNHGPMADDLLAEAFRRAGDLGATTLTAERPKDARAEALLRQSTRVSAVERRALLGLALARSATESSKLAEVVKRLEADRAGRRWSPDSATGPAAATLAAWYEKHQVGGERYQLTIVVNNREAAKINVDPTAATQLVNVAAENLVEGKQRIQFVMTGRGHLAYRCTLSGFVAADQLKTTTKTWEARRTVEPAAPELFGRELPRGIGVVQGSYSEFHNPLTQLPIGRRGRVELQLWRTYQAGLTPEDRLEYLVVREPLAAGVAVVEQSVRGGFERYELLPGEIVFYVGNRRSHERITFDFVGGTAGDYKTAPTMVFDAHEPERFVVVKQASLAVLPRGGVSVDAYRLSPDELFELGKRHFERHDWAAVRLHLGQLLKEWTIETAPYQESLKMLLDAHLQLGPPADIVKYFELVKEKSPDTEIEFEKILKVGAAYHELGEYERSYLVFRATVESSFMADGGVAGFLESQGEFLRSIDVMGKLIAVYPPEPYAAAAEYALAQQVYGFAASVEGDAKLRQRKLTRLSLIAAARQMLDDFLTAHPDDPAADQAAFAEANALLELKQFDLAVTACKRFAERYPTSDFLDSYWYIIGYAHFAAGRPDEALEMCRKVAETKRTEKSTGRQLESRNRMRALYILGQIYHSLGKAADAIREYTLVADQIPDAKKAIEYFTRRAIELPEVTTIRPGEKTSVTLKFRNVPKCELRAYRIDLMKFSLLRQNLAAITQINLSGIRPLHEETIELGDGKDYRDRERELTLPLKDEGAYLVVCRGENLHTSGFVLVSPLKLEVQEDPASGQVRTTLKNVTDDKYAAGVHVKVIGARDSEFKSGETDLRGVFTAEPVAGRSTVIAQVDGQRYAFYRGEADLLPQANAGQDGAQQQPGQAGNRPAGQTEANDYLLQELNTGNSLLQRQQMDNLRDNYYNNRNKGVKAKAAY